MSDQCTLQPEKPHNGTRKKWYTDIEGLESVDLSSIERGDKKTQAWFKQEWSRFHDVSADQFDYHESQFADLKNEYKTRHAEDEAKNMRIINRYKNYLIELLGDQGNQTLWIQILRDALLKWASSQPYFSGVSQGIGPRTAIEGSRSANLDNPSTQPSTSKYTFRDELDDDLIIIKETKKRTANDALATESEPRPRKRRETLRTPQWNKPLTTRRIPFREVFRDGKPQHEILEYPKDSGQRYIALCEEHRLEFGRSRKGRPEDRRRIGSFRSACKHLQHHHGADDADLEGHKSFEAVISNMGIHVYDCSGEDQEKNNSAFHHAVMNGQLVSNPNVRDAVPACETSVQLDLEASSDQNNPLSTDDGTVDGLTALEPPTILDEIVVPTDGAPSSALDEMQDFDSLVNNDAFCDATFEPAW
ncbi:hypothetical protein GGI35DRAFT_311431 [Trichoderma velutinum]